MHPKWQERRLRHFRDALAALEAWVGAVACYNAYVSVESLLKGLLGFSPYGDLHRLEKLPSLLDKAMGGKAPPEAVKCAECLELRAFSDEETRCVKCAEVIMDALYSLLSSRT